MSDPDDSVRPCAKGTPRTLRVLVADDHEVNRTLYAALLRRRGHVVVTVDDGTTAVECVASSPFDMVLMDIEMPLMKGTEATERIRAQEKESGSHLPIVALTAHSSGHELFLQCGMDAILVKPVRPAAMDALLERLFPSAGLAQCDAYDRASALDRFDGQEALFREIVKLVCEDCPEALVELREGMSLGDTTRVAFVAHKLAGTLASVSAGRAQAAARHLEATIKNDPPSAPQAMEQLEMRVAEALTALREGELTR